MTMPVDLANSPPRPRRRRWLRWVVLTLLLVVGLPFGKELLARRQARAALEEAIAEVDKIDPRWRLEELEADRNVIPDDQNSALIVLAARRLMPKTWQPTIFDELVKIPPNVALTQAQADQIAAELKPLETALQKARALKDHASGRYKIEYTPDFISTLMGDLQHVKPVSSLLDLDVLLHLHRKDMERAWISNRAILNASRSLGDELTLIPMLVRRAIIWLSINNLHRILGQGEMGSEGLEERLQAFQAERQVPLLWLGMRGERAGVDHLLSNIVNGKVSLTRLSQAKGSESGLDHFSDFFTVSSIIRAHGILLGWQTQAMEAAKLRSAQRYKALDKLQAMLDAEDRRQDRDRGERIALLIFTFTRSTNMDRILQTQFACTTAALAAERFRLQHKRWPESLDELVKVGLLKESPIDLFDGQPLRFRRTEDGLVIFSIGADGKYDGTALDSKARGGDDPEESRLASSRIEFRLWDVGQRRKAPAP